MALRSFAPQTIEEILTGPYGDWIIWTTLTIAFIAIVGAAAPKHFTEGKFGRAFVVAFGLILTIGLKLAEEHYHFSIESFAFIALAFLVIILSIMTFSLAKFGLRKDVAAPLTYAIMYGSFFFVAPSLFDAFARGFPPVNGLGMLLFIGCLVYLFGTFLALFLKKKPVHLAQAINGLKHADTDRGQQQKIDEEIAQEAQEERAIEQQTLPLTKRELNTLDDVERQFEALADYLRHTTQITHETKPKILQALFALNQRIMLFRKSLDVLRRHITSYRNFDAGIIHELEERLRYADNPKDMKAVRRELEIERSKIRVFDFLAEHEQKLVNFLGLFETDLGQAVERIKSHHQEAALEHLRRAHGRLGTMKSELKTLEELEETVAGKTRKAEKLLKRDKKRK
jgi:hypothetical protein